MRIFTSEDGQPWVATLYEGGEGQTQVTTKFGWEAVLFEAKAQEGGQSLAFRPAGWLLKATMEELLTALQESEWVRTRWGVDGSVQ
jgi:hypothetical protein